MYVAKHANYSVQIDEDSKHADYLPTYITYVLDSLLV